MLRLCLGALARRWQSWHSTLHFADPALEASFQVQEAVFSLSLLRLWTVLHTVSMLLIVSMRFYYYSWFRETPLAITLHLLMLFGVGLPALTVHFMHQLRTHIRPLLFTASLLFVGWCAWSLRFLTEYNVWWYSTGRLANVLELLASSPEAVNQLSRHLVAEESRREGWLHVLLVSQSFVALQPLGLSVGSGAVYLSLPVAFAIAIYAGAFSHLTDVLLTCIVIALVSAYISWHWLRMRRRQFKLDHTLQHTLAKETEVMQQLAKKEKFHKEASQHTDTILNHVLTNLMVDAAGCIQLYLHSICPAHSPDLQQAIACLDRGMKWCQRRQAILQLASEGYTPVPTKVHLHSLAKELSRGRQMTFMSLNEYVCIDKVLCEIVLDHGINHVFRHGHPDGPVVHLSMHLEPLQGNVQRLTFQITNRANPDQAVHGTDLLPQLLSGSGRHDQPLSPLKWHQAGEVQRVVMAAECHGMALSLQQVADTLVFNVSLDVQVAAALVDEQMPHGDGAPLPPGLKIFCIDDSEIARRLLTHTLLRHVTDCVVVAYGATEFEVKQFCEEAMLSADILILDQHLDYGHVSYLGSDLVQELLARGFAGFICIRSANNDPDDAAGYLLCGAHASLGKDLPPRCLAKRLAEAYHAFLGQRGNGPCSDLLPGAIPDSSSTACSRGSEGAVHAVMVDFVQQES